MIASHELSPRAAAGFGRDALASGAMPAREGSFEVSSRIGAPAAEVWAFATTAAGINEELMPIVRMTVPRGLEGDFAIADVVAPQRLGRSWLLLGGLIPFDWDDIGIERIGPGFAFSERSTMLSQRAWHHDRSVDAWRGRVRRDRQHPLRAARADARAAAETGLPAHLPPPASPPATALRRRVN